MNFFEFIVVVLCIIGFIVLRSQKYKAMGENPSLFRSRKGRLNGSSDPQREEELENEIAELHKRIAVLERIAVDERKGSDLAREIESLRN